MMKPILLCLLLTGYFTSVLVAQNSCSEPYPSCSFTYTIDPNGVTVHFDGDVKSCSSLGIILEWDFGDGSSVGDGTIAGSVESPTHTYTESGIYVVRFIARLPAPCSDRIYYVEKDLEIEFGTPSILRAEISGPTKAGECQLISYHVGAAPI